MAFFSVTTTMSNGRGGQVMFVYQVDGVRTLDELLDRLAEDGSVVGTRYQHRTDPGTNRPYLNRPKPALLTLSGLALAEPFPDDGIEIVN